jgi:hypothetical protein
MQKKIIIAIEPELKEEIELFSKSLGLSLSAFVRLATIKKLREEKTLLKFQKLEAIN